MIDFYKDLNLSRDASLDSISKELSQLESTWKRREITNPEKATKMLALIIDARKVFQTAATKAQYDQELDASLVPKPTGAPQDRGALRDKWFAEADTYFSSGQKDLAKTAIDKALSYIDSNEDNHSIYYLASAIYDSNGDYQIALDYINKAILDSPNNTRAYIHKAMIFRHLASAASGSGKQAEVNDYTAKHRQVLDMVIGLADKSGNKEDAGVAYGLYASSLYEGVSPNWNLAKQYAEKAVELGDALGSGKRVLDAMQDRLWKENRRSFDYYICIPVQADGPHAGLYYVGHWPIMDIVEATLIYVFIGREVKISYDGYEALRNQCGGYSIEDREECWYNWNIPNEGKVHFHMMDQAPDSFCDAGFAKITMTYEGTDSGFALIKDKMNQFLAALKTKGIEVMDTDQVLHLKEPRINQFRKARDLCTHCGGPFKGLFTKKCTSCGRAKDY